MNEEMIAVIQREEPGNMILAALQSLFEYDSYLLEVDANERSISYRIGM